MNNVQHCAKVIGVNKNKVRVSMKQMPACATCEAQTTCGIHKAKQKEFDIECKNAAEKYKVNDNVTLYTSINTARKAITIAFLIPLLLFIFTIFVSKQLSGIETLSIFLGFIVLVFYYTFIYIARSWFNKTFRLHIKQK